ncbi:methyltransferase domain-containing protein [Streptosporangium sp. NBC_01755]|uniref:methyltransferase domain-containing protein n=1 Tax=unclassified Streptosporangium TaxID=2632669 RepID=UPI002DD8973F|nr:MULTISPECIES: methyltransferase domain-containing protein [unclassified Streptosporangium]WSA23210.1 methyltransferase domain-containing protein [Streptosporangium sp. NBC_01810]WSC98651.1 methyltransferase domain-containing protein [Streptosporangium sp. NBC_01755]
MNTHQSPSPEIRRRLDAMAAGLEQAGALISPRWMDAFTHVPRHVFVPRLFTQGTDARGITVWCPLDHGDREAWLDAAYSDTTLVTALDEDTVAPTDGGGMTGIATSSSTAPSLMARMLEDLRVEDGQRVLEVGTGTGYNAALLSHVLGDRRVHSVDIHPALVEAARERLASIGFKPALISGDGRHGFPEHAPYDRIIATCSVTAIPRAWLEQTRPGGVILTDVTSGIEGGLARLTVGEGLRAEGRFTSTTGRFMASRHSERTYEQPRRPTYAPVSGTRDSTVSATDIQANYAFRLLLGGLLPGLELVYHHDDATGALAVQLQRPDGAVWARIPLPGHPGEGTVTWGGTQNIWHRVEGAWWWWADRGKPDHTRFGITADIRTTGMWWQLRDEDERIPIGNLAL